MVSKVVTRSSCSQVYRGHGRMLGPTTNLWAALLTIIALSIFMNWWQYHYVSRHVSDGNAKNDELFLNKSFSRRPESMQRTELGAFLRSRRGVIDVHSRLPEIRDHFAKLSVSSEIDADDLRKYLANKSASVYNPGSWDGAGIVIEEYKLVFFTQGKVACTVFKQLFRRMMGIENWMVDSAHLPHNPQKNGLSYLYHYNIADALTILTHPSWTRAVFVRDPKERTLSAFLDKAARKNGQYVKRHCCNAKNATCGEEANSSFLGFLRVVRKCKDPHWNPQTLRIDDVFKSYINFVGHFDRIQNDTKKLLESLKYDGINDNNLWTTFGASGWGKYGNESIFSKGTKAKHQTSATANLRRFYNLTSETMVEKIFSADYNDPILNFTRFSLFDTKTK